MQEKTTALPENIQAAIDHHQTAKQAFIDSYDKYKATLARLDKHRKTAQAAHNQVQQTGQQWRELIRLSDGALTKEITALRRKETEDNDLAEEFDKVVLEVERIALVSEREAYDAWVKHDAAYSDVTYSYDAFIFQNTMDVLLGLPETKIVAFGMDRLRIKVGERQELDYGVGFLQSDREALDDSSLRQAQAWLWKFFQDAIKGISFSSTFDEVRSSFSLADSSLIDKVKFKPLTPVQANMEKHLAKDANAYGEGFKRKWLKPIDA